MDLHISAFGPLPFGHVSQSDAQSSTPPAASIPEPLGPYSMPRRFPKPQKNTQQPLHLQEQSLAKHFYAPATVSDVEPSLLDPSFSPRPESEERSGAQSFTPPAAPNTKPLLFDQFFIPHFESKAQADSQHLLPPHEQSQVYKAERFLADEEMLYFLSQRRREVGHLPGKDFHHCMKKCRQRRSCQEVADVILACHCDDISVQSLACWPRNPHDL